VKVIPRSSKNELLELDSKMIRATLNAPPIEGKANQALVELLARSCRVPKGSVEILSGKKSRRKVILIRGLGLDVVLDRLSGKRS
jgi:uncharacterized protein (TIGR00251 family)